MASPAKKQAVPTLGQRIDGLIESYNQLDSESDALIDAWIDEFARSCPGVPKGTLRMMELDARSTAYCHREALLRLRSKL